MDLYFGANSGEKNTRARYLEVVEKGRARGVGSVIPGCAEIGLLVSVGDFGISSFRFGEAIRERSDSGAAIALKVGRCLQKSQRLKNKTKLYRGPRRRTK
ncbi:MAG: hypothetical protein ACRECW_11175 [Phyllobacterium sp.]